MGADVIAHLGSHLGRPFKGQAPSLYYNNMHTCTVVYIFYQDMSILGECRTRHIMVRKICCLVDLISLGLVRNCMHICAALTGSHKL